MQAGSRGRRAVQKLDPKVGLDSGQERAFDPPPQLVEEGSHAPLFAQAAIGRGIDGIVIPHA